MGIQLTLYENFSKRKNSTKRPTDGTTIEVNLKAPTSLEAPTFLLEGEPGSVNYCSCFGHFYFIDNITYIRQNYYEISCSQDVLATYKDTIGASTQFVERAASSFDADITDNLVSTKQSIVHRTQINTNVNAFNSTGCYLVRVASSGTSSGISEYALNEDQLGELLYFMSLPDNFADIFEADWGNICKSILNPFKYLIDVRWVPFTINTITEGAYTQVNPLRIGYWDSAIYPVKVPQNGYAIVKLVNKPSRYFNDWRDANPNCTVAKMWLPGVGLIDIDPALLVSSLNLYVTYYVDRPTGAATAYLSSGSSMDTAYFIASYPAQLSAPIQFAQTIVDVAGIGTNLLSAAGGAMAKNLPVAAAGAVDAVQNFLQPTTNISGSQGNRAAITAFMDIYISVTNYATGEAPLSTAGKPLFKNVQISTLSGYIKCGNASLDISGYGNDKETVNNFLNSGFYYE